MTTLTQPALLDPTLDPVLDPPSSRARAAGVDLPAVAALAALLAVAGWLAHRWWSGVLVLPMSWEPASPQALFLLPGAVVMGLLGLRLTAGDDDAGHRLTVLTTRWAGVWAGVSSAWLVATMADLYGGFGRLLAADNLVAVMGSSRVVAAQLAVVQVALLIALFGTRLGGRLPSVGLLALAAAAILGAFPFYAAGHGHGALGLPAMVPALAAVQALALALWVGTLLALPHLAGRGLSLRRGLPGLGALLTLSVVLVGLGAVAAGFYYPGLPTPLVLAVAEAAGVALLVTVGRRHRERVGGVVAARRGVALAGYAAGEVVLMVAVVLLTCWLPTSG